MEPISITIGADPELFLQDPHGNPKSAIGLFGGTKRNPRPLFWAGNPRPGFFVQEDNVAVEFNIPPADTLEQFMESIQWSVQKISEESSDQNYFPLIKASAIFTPEELEHPSAKHFGCDPDFNAWKGGRPNHPPQANAAYRSAGGHIHVGLNKKTSILRMVKAMDLFLGVPSVLMDEDIQRRNLYGKAGSFRPQDYGWEYRVLSNFWIQSKDHIKWAYEQTQRAIEFVLSQDANAFDGFIDEIENDIQTSINDSNPNIAARLCSHYNLICV